MKTPASVKGLETLGRIRRSNSFFLRDFLFSEISAIHGIPNIPDNPDLATAAGRRLCAELLEPLNATVGGINIRSGSRSAALNEFGNRYKLNCTSGLRRTHLGPPRRRWLHGSDRMYCHPVVRRPVCQRGRLAGTGLVDPRPPDLFTFAVLPQALCVQPPVARTPPPQKHRQLYHATRVSDETRHGEPRRRSFGLVWQRDFHSDTP